MTDIKIKLPTYKELAKDLGVSDSAVKQYNRRKRELMLKGLLFEQIGKDTTVKDNSKNNSD